MDRSEKKITLAELAELTGGKVVGDGGTLIEGACSIDNPVPGHIAFIDSISKRQATGTRPEALIVKRAHRDSDVPLLIHGNPRLAFTLVLRHFHPEPEFEGGIHPNAWVDPKAEVDPTAWIGPCAVIEAGAKVMARVWIDAGVYVGRDSIIGESTKLYPNSTVMHDATIGVRCIIHPGVVIGSDGFGFTPTEEGNMKVPQIGRVEIGDDVEIGANSAVDRASLDATRIADDVKLDNLVQVAHNVQIGSHTRIAAQVGLSGRVVIEDNVVVAGQAGFQNGITVGKGSVVAGQSGVTRHVPAGSRISGYPARDHRKALALLAAQNRLPEMIDKLEKLEEQLEIRTSKS